MTATGPLEEMLDKLVGEDLAGRAGHAFRDDDNDAAPFPEGDTRLASPSTGAYFNFRCNLRVHWTPFSIERGPMVTRGCSSSGDGLRI